MTTDKHFEDIECLPECDERHAEGCPREKAEMEYYRQYFAVGTPAFYNFRPEGCTCGPDYQDRYCARHGIYPPEEKWGANDNR